MQAFMVYYTELSKYFLALMIAFYAYEGFAVFRFDSEERRTNIYIRQNILMALIHLGCFISIFFATQNLDYLFFYFFQLIVLYAFIVLFRLIYPKANRLLVNNMCLLLSIGFAILTRLSYNRAMRQFLIATASLAMALCVPYLLRKLKILSKLTWLYAATGALMLLAVYVLGETHYGSRRMISIAGVSFQPSELVKLLFVFFVAAALYKSSDIKQVVLTMLVAAFHVIILVASRDLGSALIFFVVFVMMVYLATGQWWYLIAGALGGSAAAVVAYHLFSHVQVRVQAFMDPWSVIDSQGYQITQSLFAISSGGLFGLGFYKGQPTSIPIVEADFIFSAMAEELGLVFCICVILVCLSSFIMFMNLAVRFKERFYQLVAFGLGITYIFQVFLAIGGGVKFIPMTGLTLPFISYGGTSVLVSIIMFAIVAGLYVLRSDEGKIKTRRDIPRRAGAKAPPSSPANKTEGKFEDGQNGQNGQNG